MNSHRTGAPGPLVCATAHLDRHNEGQKTIALDRMQVIFKDFKKQKVTIDVGLDDTVSLDIFRAGFHRNFVVNVDIGGWRCWLQNAKNRNFY